MNRAGDVAIGFIVGFAIAGLLAVQDDEWKLIERVEDRIAKCIDLQLRNRPPA